MRKLRTFLLALVPGIAACAHGGARADATAPPGRPLGTVAAAGSAGFTTAAPTGRGYHAPLAELARRNQAFREEVYTDPREQIAVMSLRPDESTGAAAHADVEQIYVCVGGSGRATVDGVDTPFRLGDVIVVPPGVAHDIRNVGPTPLKFYTVDTPPLPARGRGDAPRP